MSVKFGVIVPQGWGMDLVDIADPVEQYEAMTRVVREAERLGFDSIWLYDHFHTVPTPELETTFECWTTTAALARDTSTIRIGQMVTSNSYRNPALLAKMASTVDVMSHGRLNFGIGAGWYEHEYRAYGYPYPPQGERLQMMGEAVQVIRAMWTQPRATFEGRHYQVLGAINEPKGVQQPHIPLWIGGGGEQVTLKLLARYGDAGNFSQANPVRFRHKCEVLQQHCVAVGRDYDSILRSAFVPTALLSPSQDAAAITEKMREGEDLERFRTHAVVGAKQEVIDRFGEVIEAGAQYFILADMPDLVHLEMLQRFGEEVLPAFREDGGRSLNPM